MNQQTLINRFTSKGYQPALVNEVATMLTREYSLGKHCGQIIFKDGECATLQSQDVQHVLNNQEINMSKYTRNEILAMPDKERTELYNKVTGKSVKRVQKSNDKAVDAILEVQKSAPLKVSEQNKSTASNKKSGRVDLKGPTSVKRPKEGSVSETIWLLADAMPGKSRAEVVAACVLQDINEATAKTQYQRWSKANAGN